MTVMVVSVTGNGGGAMGEYERRDSGCRVNAPKRGWKNDTGASSFRHLHLHISPQDELLGYKHRDRSINT